MIDYKRKHKELFAATFSEWLKIRWANLNPYSFQQKIIDLVDRYDGGVLPIYIVGASGGGKTTLMNEYIMYTFLCYNNMRVRFISQTEKQSTGNSFDSVKKLIIDLCETDEKFKKTITITDLRITHNSSNSFVEIRNVTTVGGKEGSLKGFHSIRGGVSLQIVDECDAMPQSVWNALASNVTNDNGIVVCMSNGGDINSHAYQVWSARDKFWNKIHFTAADISTFNWDVANSRRLTEGGDVWYSRYVLAEFVASGNENLFPNWLIEKARERTPVNVGINKIVCGLDIGGNSITSESSIATTALAVRCGNQILTVETIQDNTLEVVIDRIYGTLKRVGAHPSSTDIYVDSIGSGMNYTGQVMRQHGLRAVAFFGNAAGNLTQGRNMRAEVYMLLQQWLMRGGSLMGVPEPAIDQLRYIEYVESTRDDNKIFLKKKRRRLKGIEQAGLDMLDAISFTFASPKEGEVIADGFNRVNRQKKNEVYSYGF